jgi:hypothetical protein
MSAETIKFDNLISEARYAFHAGDYRRSEALLAEAHAMAVNAADAKEKAS